MIIPGILTPIISRVFVDDILVDNLTDWLWPLLFGLLANGVLLALLNVMQGQAMQTLQTRFSIAHNSRFMQQVLALPLRFFAQRSAAEMATRPQIIDRLGSLVSGPLGMAAIGWITASSYFLVMFYFDALMSLGVLVIFAVNLLYFLWQANQLQSLNQVMVREKSQYAGASMQALQLLPEVKASGAENWLFSRLLGQKAKLNNQVHASAEKKDCW